MSNRAQTSSARRPGGRTAEVRARINHAVLELLFEGGTDACSFKAVAERAGVERSTLYRRYPDRWEMMIDSFVGRASEEVVSEPGLTFRAALTSVLTKLVAQLESPVGPAMLVVAAEARARSGTDHTRSYFDGRMAQLSPMFDDAIARGELPSTVDREGLFTLAAGSIYFRLFIAARKVDNDFIHSLVDRVCSIFCVPK